MIHDRSGDPAPFGAENSNPFYLFCDGVPLPIAVRNGNPEAMAFRDGWEMASTQEFRRGYLFDPQTRNWVGGAEDGADAVSRAMASAMDDNQKQLPAIEDHVGQDLQCEAEVRQEHIRQLREQLTRHRDALRVILEIDDDRVDDILEVMNEPSPWIT